MPKYGFLKDDLSELTTINWLHNQNVCDQCTIMIIFVICILWLTLVYWILSVSELPTETGLA